MSVLACYIVFFKRKTAYERRISDWISVVCSSDLCGPEVDQRDGAERIEPDDTGRHPFPHRLGKLPALLVGFVGFDQSHALRLELLRHGVEPVGQVDRKSAVEGKGVSLRVRLGGGRLMQKKR